MLEKEQRSLKTYIVSLEGVEKTYGVTADDLEARGILGRKDVELLESGKTKAVRISTINALCEEIGCQPGELFVALKPPDLL